jgi:RHS repeat-associated protein
MRKVMAIRRRWTAAIAAVLVIGVAEPQVAATPAAAAPAPTPLAVPSGPGVTYAHDANGRVTAAFTPAGDGSKIGYDAVGNITGITPMPAGTLAVAQLWPPAAAVGTPVDVFGTHFGTDPSLVTVAFGGGVSAHPSAILGNKATVTVPANAATGAVTVTAGGATATGPALTVVSRAAPTITGVSPTVVDPGAAVTVTGTGFQTTATDNRIDMGGSRVAARSATATSLTLGMPAASTDSTVRPFGKVRLSTPDGTATSTQDVFVAPKGHLAADVSTPIRIAGSTTATLSIAANKIGLAVFDVPANGRATVTLSAPTFVGTYPSKIWSSRFELVAHQDNTSSTQTYSIDPQPTAASYEIEVDPALGQAGSVQVQVQSGTDQTAAITVGGASATLTTSAPNLQTRFTFPGTAGQRVLANLTYAATPMVNAMKSWIETPSGGRLDVHTLAAQTSSTAQTDVLNGVVLPSTGTYTVVLSAPPPATLTATVNVRTAVANPTATTTVDGAAGALTLNTAGQLGTVTFTGAVGQKVWIEFTNTYTTANTPGMFVSVAGPDGFTVAPEHFVNKTADSFEAILTLTQAGVYSVFVDPAQSETGTSRVAVTTVPAPATIAAAVDGTAHNAAIAFGQDATATFTTAAANQKVSATIDTSWVDVSDMQWVLTGPAGFSLRSCPTCARFVDAVVLPTAGQYTLSLDLVGRDSGTLTVKVFAVPVDATTSTTIGAAAKGIANTVPGQGASMTFNNGTANQRVKITCALSPSAGSTPISYKLIEPDTNHTVLVNQPSACPLGGVLTSSVTLPITGIYTIAVDPFDRYIGTFTFQVTVTTAAAAKPTIGTAKPDTAKPGTAKPDTAKPDTAKPDTAKPGTAKPRVTEADPTPDRGNPRDLAPTPAARPVPPTTPSTVDSTVLTGQIRRTDGQPIPGVTLRIDGRSTRTNADGRFRLTGLPRGTRTLRIDGRPASRGTVHFGVFDYRVALKDAITTLPYTPYLPVLDTAHEIAIDSPTTHEVVVTNPGIEGLEVHIPAGVTITDADGKAVHRLGITPIPVDRTPIPMPQGVQVPVYFTVQPAGGELHGGAARLVYPNYLGQKPGTQVNFWHYETDTDGWEIYGSGRVDGHGRQVQPDPGTKIYDFDGAMINVVGFVKDLLKSLKESLGLEGDPVDLGTGLFQLTQTDLAEDDVVPLALTRSYNSGSGQLRAAGLGMNHNYDLYLNSAHQYSEVDLELPNGSEIHYARTSPGTSFADAIFTASGAPTSYVGSTVSFNGDGWDLTTVDGTTLIFGDVSPLQAIRDRRGNTIKIIRAHQNLIGNYEGDITAVETSNGSWLSFTYATAGSHSVISQVEDNAGRTVKYGYNTTTGTLTSVTDADNKQTTYGYDASNRLTTITDPKLKTFLTNHYDANGRVDQQTVDGGTYTFEYTLTSGKVTATKVTDPRSHVRNTTYDAAGYLVKDVHAVGTPSEQTYTITRDTTSHQVTDLKDPLGHVVHTVYDAVGAPKSSTAGFGLSSALTSSATYNGPFHQVDTSTDTAGKTATYGFDTGGNENAITDVLGHGGTAHYRPDGQPDSVTTAGHETSTFGYTDGQLTSVTDANGNKTTVFRDAANRPSVMTLPSGQRSITRYDAANLVTQQIAPDGTSTSFTYDENGNLKKVTDAKGHFTTFDYDDFGRIHVRTDPLLKTDTYTYDANGNLVLVLDRRGKTTEFRYDERERLSFAGYGRTGTAAPFTYESSGTYTYDADGKPKTITDTASATGAVTLGYDDLDRMTSIADARGTVGYGYDTAGRLNKVTSTGQPDINYGYDNASRLTTVTKGAAASPTPVATYTLDDAGRPTTVALPGGVSIVTGYDPAGRLSTVDYRRGTAALGNLVYDYDRDGLRDGVFGSYARLSLPAAESGQSYDAADRLTAVSGRTLGYDDSGNLTTDGPTSYTWDARGTMTKVVDGTGTSTLGYDALGNLAKVTKGAVTTTYQYDGSSPLSEQAVNGSTTTTTGYVPDPYAGTPLTRTTPTATQAYLTDAQDSTVALTDSAGALVASYTYDPFGAASSNLSSDPNAIRYTGQPSSPAIPGGLQYNNARYYSPALHRFTSQDPLGLGGGTTNTYRYADADPADLSDRSGLVAGADTAGACVGGGLLRDTIGFLSGHKHTFADFAKGFLKGCVDGALLTLGAPEIGAARGAAEEAVEVGAKEAGETAGREVGEHIDDTIPRSGPEPCNCFPAGTSVDTADGKKPIEQVKVGDKVVAHDLTTGKSELRTVTGVFHKQADDLLTITADGKQLHVTPQHGFWVVDKGWTAAGQLVTGDRLLRRDGTPTTVTAITQHHGPVTVYNLSVEGDHDFYASDVDVLVHNCALSGPGADTAERIGNGHAFTKHVVGRGEFAGVRTRGELSEVVGDIMANPDAKKNLGGGKIAYWKRTVIVIFDPKNPDRGTIFAPTAGKAYFDGL